MQATYCTIFHIPIGLFLYHGRNDLFPFDKACAIHIYLKMYVTESICNVDRLNKP